MFRIRRVWCFTPKLNRLRNVIGTGFYAVDAPRRIGQTRSAGNKIARGDGRAVHADGAIEMRVELRADGRGS
jgi:hypothetical protein